MRYQTVDHHVAGPDIEGEDVLWRRPSGDRGQVGDAADIDRQPAVARATEQLVIDEGHQRRALAAGGNIALAKIRNCDDTCALRHNRGFADLQRAGDAAAEIFDGVAFVEDRLAVEPAQIDRGERDASPPASLANGLRI